MLNVKKTLVVSLACVAANFAVADTDHDGKHPKAERKNHCAANTVIGTYVGAIPGATTFVMYNTPLNESNSKLLVSIDTTGNADPSARGLFGTAVGMTSPRGTFKRSYNSATGLYSYNGQLARYRYDSRGAVVGTEIQGARIDINDCDSAKVSFVSQVYFYGYVNVGQDSLPAPDVVVDVSGFPGFTINKFGE